MEEKITKKEVKSPIQSTLEGILKFIRPAPPAKKPEKAPETMVTPRAKAKVTASAQRYLAIKEVKDGCVILKNDALRAIIMVSSINFALMSEDEQKGKVYAYQEFLNSLDFPIQIVIQSKKLNISGYLDRVRELERVQENELLRLQTAEYAEFVNSLVELANITSNHYYVVVPYSGPGVGEGKKGIADRIKDYFQPAKKVAEERISFERAKEALDLRVSSILSGLAGIGVRCARLDTQEIVELFYTTYNPDTSAQEILTDLERLEIAR